MALTVGSIGGIVGAGAIVRDFNYSGFLFLAAMVAMAFTLLYFFMAETRSRIN